MKNFLRLFILAIAAAVSGQAFGQAVSKYPAITVSAAAVGSIVTGQASLTVGPSTGNVALGSAGPTVDVYNPGTLVVYVKLGVGSGTTAAATDYPVAPGSHTILNTNGTATYIAAIAPSGTPTLTITTGTGSPLGWGGGGGGGGGGTVTQGAAAGSGPWIVTQWIAGSVNSATNGIYSNLLQGNAALTGANPLFAALSIGGAINAVGNPIFVSPGTGAVWATNTTLTPSSSSTVGITPVVSAAAESGHILKGSAGNLYAIYAVNLTAISGFLGVSNTTTVPADGVVAPLDCVQLPASGTASISYSPGPPGVYSTGMSAWVSSAANCLTKTTGTITAFFHGMVQ